MVKNLITGVNTFVKFHDDMTEKDSTDEVKIVPFPYMDLFGDFRIFNGISIAMMDEYIGKIREIFIEIANEHAVQERTEKLSARKEQSKT